MFNLIIFKQTTDNTSVYNIHLCLLLHINERRVLVSLDREKQVAGSGLFGRRRYKQAGYTNALSDYSNFTDCQMIVTYVGPFGGYMSARQSSVYCRGRHKHSVLGRQLQTPRLCQMFCFQLTNVTYRRDKLCWNKREKSSQYEKNTVAHFWGGGFGHSAAAVSVFQTECGSCFCLSRDNHFTLAQDGGGDRKLSKRHKTAFAQRKEQQFHLRFQQNPFPPSLIPLLFAMKSTKTFWISGSGIAAHPSEQSVVSSARKRRGIIYLILPCHDPSVGAFLERFASSFRSLLVVNLVPCSIHVCMVSDHKQEEKQKQNKNNENLIVLLISQANTHHTVIWIQEPPLNNYSVKSPDI